MIIQVFNYVIFGVCCVTVYGLFMIKDQVRTFDYQNEELNKQVLAERDKIHMLQAEMAYLTSPERLQLSIKHLDLENIHSSQMIADPLLLKVGKQYTDNYITSDKIKHRIKWRYKKAPSRYIRQVVARHD